jgi:DNA-directed RNA polymerase specialized sigma24 family protein
VSGLRNSLDTGAVSSAQRPCRSPRFLALCCRLGYPRRHERGYPQVDLLALDEALDKLAGQDPRKAELVKLRFFGGLTIEQAAAALGIAPSTADADWAYAKA